MLWHSLVLFISSGQNGKGRKDLVCCCISSWNIDECILYATTPSRSPQSSWARALKLCELVFAASHPYRESSEIYLDLAFMCIDTHQGNHSYYQYTSYLCHLQAQLQAALVWSSAVETYFSIISKIECPSKCLFCHKKKGKKIGCVCWHHRYHSRCILFIWIIILLYVLYQFKVNCPNESTFLTSSQTNKLQVIDAG